MRVSDTASGAIIAALATAVYVHAGSFPDLVGQNVGPSAFPRAIAAVMFICGVALILQGVRSRTGDKLFTVAPWVGWNRTTSNVLMIPAALVAYILASEFIGFIPTAAAVLATLFGAFGVRIRTSLAIACIGAVAIHVLFYGFLKVPLPWGLVPILW